MVRIVLPAAMVGSVNVWLLRGDPLTLVDTGERFDASSDALEAGLTAAGVRVEDIELLALTHHHVDHTGLLETLRGRSGAAVAALDRVADYGVAYDERTECERAFSEALLLAHGVPREMLGRNARLWDHIRERSGPFGVSQRLAVGDVLAMGSREYRVVHRPGHSSTDTLFVDEHSGMAIGGDHLLARISSIAEMSPAEGTCAKRRRALVEYLTGLDASRAMPLDLVLGGHGDPVTGPADLITERLGHHRLRCDAILGALAGRGERTCFEIAGSLWDAALVREQPTQVVWEVLGHLDLLHDAGRVVEHVADGVHRFALA